MLNYKGVLYEQKKTTKNVKPNRSYDYILSFQIKKRSFKQKLFKTLICLVTLRRRHDAINGWIKMYSYILYQNIKKLTSLQLIH